MNDKFKAWTKVYIGCYTASLFVVAIGVAIFMGALVLITGETPVFTWFPINLTIIGSALFSLVHMFTNEGKKEVENKMEGDRNGS